MSIRAVEAEALSVVEVADRFPRCLESLVELTVEVVAAFCAYLSKSSNHKMASRQTTRITRVKVASLCESVHERCNECNLTTMF